MTRILPWCLAWAVVLPAASSRADDWPQFKRDAARTGDNPDATLSFPLRRVTAVRFPSPIYASPAVVAGRVYVQDARGHVACIDGRANKVVWLTDIGGVNNSSSPAVAFGKVYIGSTAGAILVLDAESGRILAKVPAPGGVITAPAVTERGVYFTTFGGKLIKLDRAGKVVWTYDGGRTSITEFAVDGDRILFFAGTDAVAVHEIQDQGEEYAVLRKKSLPSQCAPVGGPLPLADGRFMFQSYDSEFGRAYLGETIFFSDSCDARVTSSRRDGLVYRGDRCFNAARPNSSVWHVDPAVLHDGGSHSSPALGKNVMVLGTEQGKVYAVPLAGTDKVRKPVWEFAALNAGGPNGGVSSSPALVDGPEYRGGAVYFGGEDGILYGLGQGEEAPVVDAPAPASAADRSAERLAGGEWPTVGGDAGFSCVAGESKLRPPYDVAWQTRVWSTFKAPMIVGGGKVFAAGRMGPLLALDAATGEILWKYHHPSVESRTAPTYADGKLFLMRIQGGLKESPYVQGWWGSDGGAGIWCHDAETGKPLWHQPMDFAYHFNPDALAVHGGKVFACRHMSPGQFEAVALDAATGKPVWTQVIGDFTPEKATGPRRFSGVMAEGLWCVSINCVQSRLGKTDAPGATLALDPDTGRIVWRNDKVFISVRTRIAARNGTVMVFNTETGAHALDARTGKQLWNKPQTGKFYMHALTDLYLDSRGERGVFKEHQCSYQVFINGLWYSHGTNSTNSQYAKRFTDDGRTQIVWKRGFLSNACPSPSPAYDRLYYAANGEGVVYCFANAETAGD